MTMAEAPGTGMVAATWPDVRSIAVTEASSKFTVYSVDPSGVIAMSTGLAPTVMAVAGVSVAMSIGVIQPDSPVGSLELAAYAVLPLGEKITSRGVPPSETPPPITARVAPSIAVASPSSRFDTKTSGPWPPSPCRLRPRRACWVGSGGLAAEAPDVVSSIETPKATAAARVIDRPTGRVRARIIEFLKCEAVKRIEPRHRVNPTAYGRSDWHIIRPPAENPTSGCASRSDPPRTSGLVGVQPPVLTYGVIGSR